MELVMMCTHILNDGILDEYIKIQKSGKETILLIDNSKKLIDPQKGKINKFRHYDNEVHYCLFEDIDLKNLNIPFVSAVSIGTSLDKVLWYNCDYFFPLIKSFFPGYDYYWRLEYDCFFNDVDYKSFFINYDNLKYDMISDDIKKPDKNWFYNRNVEWIYPNEEERLKTYFPTMRLSKSAIDLIYNRRKEIFEEYSNMDRKGCRWPHCELFVPTELKMEKMTWYNLNNLGIYRYLPPIDLNTNRIFMHPDKKLYHPIKDLLSSLTRAEEELKKMAK